MGIPIHIHFFIISVHDILGCQRRYKIPHTLITVWPPTCADDSNRGNAPFSASGASSCSLVSGNLNSWLTRRWTSASLSVSEDLCCAGGYLHLACGSFPGGCFSYILNTLRSLRSLRCMILVTAKSAKSAKIV